VTWLGITLSLMSAALALWAIVSSLVGGTVPGWASTVIPIYIVCGVQLLSLGVIGEYVGKIYLETKARPRFIVSDSVGAHCMTTGDRHEAQASVPQALA
jgi:polyisoprenyl-phosphate glycosyltransferase